METDIRYYRRRACEEMSAASRAVTPAARDRRLHLVRLYLDHLRQLNAPLPFDEHWAGTGDLSAFSWAGSEAEARRA